MLQQDPPQKKWKNTLVRIFLLHAAKNCASFCSPFCRPTHGHGAAMVQLDTWDSWGPSFADSSWCKRDACNSTRAHLRQWQDFGSFKTITVPSWTTTCAHTMNVHLMPQPLYFFVFHGSAFNPKAGLCWIDVPITLILGAHMCHHVPRIPLRYPQSSGFEVMDSNLGQLTGPGLARTRSKCSTHRPSWAAGRASGAETSHVERHFAQLHFARKTFWHSKLNTLSSHTSGYVPNWFKLGTQNGHMSGENDWDCGAPYQTDPSVNWRILLLLLTPQPREEQTCLRAIPAFLS